MNLKSLFEKLTALISTSLIIKEVQVCLLLLLLSVLSFLFVDCPLLIFIRKQMHLYKPFFQSLSFLIFPPLFLGCSFLAILFCRLFSRFKSFLQMCFAINLSQCLSIAFVRLLKVFAGRARPDLFLKDQTMGFKGFSFNHYFHSFPSGHTMAAFTLASSLSFFFPRYRVLLLLCAFFLSLSRLFLFDHYLSDVLGTAALGFIISWLTHLSVDHLVEINPVYRK